jgi:hypothetical protein
MAIPEAQLNTWSHQGGITTAKNTADSVKNALAKFDKWPQDAQHEVFLQGSYKNDTNIYGDSDVDIVAQLHSSWYRDLTSLSVEEAKVYEQTYGDAQYDWSKFRSDVIKALQQYFDQTNVREGKKCLKVSASSGRLPADAVAAIDHRKYTRFHSVSDFRYIEGMKFFVPSENRWVINYPKQHYENGVAKNGSTGSYYKALVRIFKNARTYLVDNRQLTKEIAPSYFLECLLYNVPNANFGTSYQMSFSNILKWLSQNDIRALVCQNGFVPLFDGSPEQWSLGNAKVSIDALIRLWNNWNK